MAFFLPKCIPDYRFSDKWVQYLPLIGIPAELRGRRKKRNRIATDVQSVSGIAGMFGAVLLLTSSLKMPQTNQQYNQAITEGLPPATYEEVQSISRERWVRKLDESDYTADEIREFVKGERD
ncbi:hypothetical protein HN832_02535 [archaeon]|jgi:hypothetical protein|nr:hypothetical protein [archaeon]MBT4373231.1 hypothetical protein [archaeon]MBT4531576.1 hypothetical protein [archaeon]MBT7001246.1 hypothetical protein [archaeon]MBT7282268.1 hypothetical protein [archaeon]